MIRFQIDRFTLYVACIVLSPTVPYLLSILFVQFEFSYLSSPLWHAKATWTAVPVAGICVTLVSVLGRRVKSGTIRKGTYSVFLIWIVNILMIVVVRNMVALPPATDTRAFVERTESIWFALFVLFLILTSDLVAMLALSGARSASRRIN